MKIFETDPDHFIVVWMDYIARSEERDKPYFCLDDFKNYDDDNLKILRYDPIKVITEFCQSVSQYGGGKIAVKRGKKRVRVQYGTGKYKTVPTENYTGADVFELLSRENIDTRSLSLHEFYIENHEVVMQNVYKQVSKMLDEFVNGSIINGVTFQVAKKKVYKRLLAHVELENSRKKKKRNIFIGSNSFPDIENFPFMHTCIIFGKLGYIGIGESWGSGIVSYDRENYDFTNHGLYVTIEPEFQKILEKHLILEDIILETILDDKYKNLSIGRKQDTYFINRTIEHNDTDIRFTDLKKKYPYSDITAINHAGNTVKYKIKEKVKLD